MIWLDIVRIAPLACVIGYAAYKDHKTGEVSNKVWLYAPFGLALTLVSCYFTPNLLLLSVLSFVCTAIISFGIFELRGWGGADAKAFLTIGASLPVTPFLKLNLIFMYPLNVIWICAALSFTYTVIKKKGKITLKDSSRLLPYALFAMLLAIAI